MAGTPRYIAFSSILSELRESQEAVLKAQADLRHDTQTMRQLEIDHRSASDQRHYGLEASTSVAEADADEVRQSEYQRKAQRIRIHEIQVKEAIDNRLQVIGKLSFELQHFRESDWMFVETYLTSKGAPVPSERESQIASLQKFPGIVEGLLEGLLARP